MFFCPILKVNDQERYNDMIIITTRNQIKRNHQLFSGFSCYFGADGGIQTHDLSITNRLHYPCATSAYWGLTPELSFYNLFYISITLLILKVKILSQKVP